MCLGVPGRVTEIGDLTALVDFWGVSRRVRLELVDEPVAVGDYILNHVGFAIRRIPPEDVQTTLELYAQLLKENTGQGPEDLMAADVRAELAASSHPAAPSAGCALCAERREGTDEESGMTATRGEAIDQRSEVPATRGEAIDKRSGMTAKRSEAIHEATRQQPERAEEASEDRRRGWGPAAE